MKLSQNQRRAIYVAIVAILSALSYYLADTLGEEPVKITAEAADSGAAKAAPSAAVSDTDTDNGQGGK